MYNNYIESIKTNLYVEPHKWNFKSDKRYNQILEHLNYKQGYEYLYEIKKHYNNIYSKNKNLLIRLCQKNDKYGKTNKYEFKEFINCSPSNFRYILHTLLIFDNINKNKLNNIDFVEIGGGYGGLAFFIYNMAFLFNIKINSYTMFDLKEANLLQQKYLKIHNIDIKIGTKNNIYKNSYLISNYAFSEISENLRNKYSKEILNPYISYGFLTWNHINLYNFIDNKKIKSIKEYPQTDNNNKKNLYVYIYS